MPRSSCTWPVPQAVPQPLHLMLALGRLLHLQVLNLLRLVQWRGRRQGQLGWCPSWQSPARRQVSQTSPDMFMALLLLTAWLIAIAACMAHHAGVSPR
jgi:hypothetical protein